MKRCYRPRARYDAWSAAKRLGEALLPPSLGRDGLFLAPTSGYGLNSQNGLKAGKGLSPRQFAEVLRSSIFTICAPSTSAESTRIYEALESGSIPLLHSAHPSGGLPFSGGYDPPCPIPVISDWNKLDVTIVAMLQKGGRYLDALQRNISIWWQNFKAISANRTRDILWSLQTNSQEARAQGESHSASCESAPAV